MEVNPTWAFLLGDHRFDDQMEDFSREFEDATISKLRGVVTVAETIDEESLDRDDRVTLRILIAEASARAEELESRQAEFAVNPQLGFHVDYLSLFPQLPISYPEHADALIAKYTAVPRTFHQAIERLRQGISNGRTPPRIAVERSIVQIDRYLLTPVRADPMLTVACPQDYGSAEETAWRERLEHIVRREIRPAYQLYRDMLEAEVLEAARPPERSGVCWLPDGEELYDLAVRRYTSLDLSAEEVHEIGLGEIAAIAQEYRVLGDRVLNTTDVGTIYDRLRNDPKLRFDSRQAVRQHAEDALNRARDAMSSAFGRLPGADCVMVEIPDEAAEASPLAYYLPPAEDGSRGGTFFINTYDPSSKTIYESEALTFHESIPGHHLQLTIAQELDGIPSFRRHALVTAYVEGWGLYTERLADEMGLYTDDIDRMGILSFDSWRAGRLVVDTGIHAKGWSRRQAIEYLLENSPQSPSNIRNEVDRYIGWPAQALAYKIGQREIFRIRRDAESAMGSAFDLKGFHDVVLGSGPVTLPVLEDLVTEWVAA